MVFTNVNLNFWRFHNFITLTDVNVQIKYNLLQMKHVKNRKKHLLNVQYSTDFPLCEWQ
jgi:hypothetical protein